MHSVRIPSALASCAYPPSIRLCLLPSASSASSPVGQAGNTQPRRDCARHAKAERSHGVSSFCPVPCLSLSLLQPVPGSFPSMQPFSDLAGQAGHLKDYLEGVCVHAGAGWMGKAGMFCE